MLINRVSLIQTLEATAGNEFRSLISSLKSHKLKDLTLTNVLLEAQTFKILPYALKNVTPKSEMLNPDMAEVLVAWVISVTEGIKDHQRDPYHIEADNLDEVFFSRMRHGEPCPHCAADVVDHLLEDVCACRTQGQRPGHSPNRKNVFYTFCRMLDNVILQHQLNLSTLVHPRPLQAFAVA